MLSYTLRYGPACASGLVPKKAKATTGEVVLPAAGIASMSARDATRRNVS